MIRYLKLIVINLITFLILLSITNYICGISLKNKSAGSRNELPNYKQDPDYAKAIFYDYNQVKHQYEPFVGWKTLPYTGKTLTINNAGIRTHQAPAYDGNKKSALFFGGSTMWGEGSDDQHTIPALVNEIKPELEIFNHAQLAYASRQELDALISLYSKGAKPDYVIFYDGVNESAFLCPKEINQLPAHRLVPMFREKLYQSKKEYMLEVLGKLFYENIIKIIHRIKYDPQTAKSPYDCSSNPNKAKEIASIMISNWEIAHDLVERNGGKFYAFLQPAALIGKPNIEHLKIDHQLKPEFEIVYSEIRKLMETKGYNWFFDLTNSFDNNEYIYIDFCHVSANGNQIIAQKIAEKIQ